MEQVYLESVSKRFGKTIAVNNLTLKVKRGEFIVILGPSGCGKTTTLRIIAGLERPDKGRVFIAGTDVTNIPPGKRQVAMVFQFYALYPTTVFNNIALPLKGKMSKTELERKVREVAKILEIEDLLHVNVNKLAIFEKQKVALARALAKEAEVYLLDEPLTLLDPVSRIRMRHEFKKIQKEFVGTFIYVTHDQFEAMSLADRIVVMNNGVLQQEGTPEEVYFSPRNTFVATFIGEPGMNLIRAEVLEEGEHLRVKIGENTIQLPAKEGLNDNEVIIGFRPEHVAMGKRDGYLLLKGKVLFKEFLGYRSLLHIDLGDDQRIIAVTNKLSHFMKVNKNSIIELSIKPENILLFSKDGERI
mgnify:CR=1 FL=1